jgi:hypothetical protein
MSFQLGIYLGTGALSVSSGVFFSGLRNKFYFTAVSSQFMSFISSLLGI